MGNGKTYLYNPDFGGNYFMIVLEPPYNTVQSMADDHIQECRSKQNSLGGLEEEDLSVIESISESCMVEYNGDPLAVIDDPDYEIPFVDPDDL